MKARITVGSLSVLLISLIAVPITHAQVSPIVGFVRIDVQTNTDVMVSVPFNQQAVYAGAIGAINGATITVTGAPFAGQNYSNLYYVRIKNGAKAGLWSTVTINGSNTLTLANVPLSTALAVGNEFVLLPHQTLGSVFPDSLAGITFFPSSSDGSFYGTEIILPDLMGVGINRLYSASGATNYYCASNGTNAWRQIGAPVSSNFNNQLLLPDTFFILRNNTNAHRYVTLGLVETGKVGRTIPTYSVQNDLYLVSGRPVSMTLDQLMLGGTPAFVTSTNITQHKDQLLFFDNATPGQTKSPSGGNYYYSYNTTTSNAYWRKTTAQTINFGPSNVVGAATGFILRKFAGASASNDWTNTAPY
jgi:uncharacterized protein (TIGR02597 family)